MLTCYVNGQCLTVKQPIVAADTIDYITAEFIFRTDEWDGLDKIAVFRQGEVTRTALLVNNRIEPSAHVNLTAGEWELGLIGEGVSGIEIVKRITTELKIISVDRAAPDGGDPFPEYDTEAGEQILAQAIIARNAAQNAQYDAETAEQLARLYSQDALRYASRIENLGVTAHVAPTSTPTVEKTGGTGGQPFTLNFGIPKAEVTFPVTTNLIKGDGMQGALPAVPSEDYVVPNDLNAIVKFSNFNENGPVIGEGITLRKIHDHANERDYLIPEGTYSKPAGGIPASDLASGVLPSYRYDPDENIYRIDDHDISAKYDSNSDEIATKYATKTEMNTRYSPTNPPPYPVSSVNGKTGIVTLVPSDLGIGSVFTLKGSKTEYSQLPSTGNVVGDVWYVTSESVGYIWLFDGSTYRWEKLGMDIDLSAYRTASAQDEIDNAQNTAINAKYTKPQTGIPASDLASGVIPTVPTQLSQLAGDSTHRTVTDAQIQLFTTVEDKLDASDVLEDPNEHIYKIGLKYLAATYDRDGNEIETAYAKKTELPTVPTQLSQLAGDSTHRTVTDTEKEAWNGKQNALGFTPENAANKVTSISASSTDTQYPSAKAVYAYIQSLDGNGVRY